MNVITVSQLNKYINAIFAENNIFQNIYISGEISNFLFYQRSGHMYFTLKDETSQLKCVMFASNAKKLKFLPQDGMKVICRGSVSVYEKDGSYQLYATDIQPVGLGALNLAYEQLKEKLQKEGLFDDINKKSLPKYPRSIGVATSNMGAAVEDIKNITKRRFPLSDLIISPTVVQGETAPKSIIKSIKILDQIDEVDVIIVGRGGGSIEDLWAFNDEEVARAVFNCKTPIISAVGHETDFTICDFVSDLRAPTPSAAAELAVPNINDEYVMLETLKNQLLVSISSKINNEKQRFDYLLINSTLNDLNEYFENKIDVIETYSQRISENYKYLIEKKQNDFKNIVSRLDALSPLGVLSRGYAIAMQDKKIIKSKNDINKNNELKLSFFDGSVKIDIGDIKYE